MRTRWLPMITGLFVAVLIISNIASVKPVVLWRFTFDGGTILFPLSYIFGDVLTEVYGYRASRRVIWTGFISTFLMAIVLWIVGRLPAAEADWGPEKQAAYSNVLAPVGRIVVASLIAYFAGEFSNSYVLAKMKIWTRGRFLWTRTIGSTLVGEGVDTLIFCLAAFLGVWSTSTVVAIIISNYIFKCGIEIVATPVTYAVVIALKRWEGTDVYDIGTNFSPFRVFENDIGGSNLAPDIRG